MDRMSENSGSLLDNNYEIDLFELWRIVCKRRRVVLLVVLLFLVGAGLYASFSREVFKVTNAIVLSKINNVQLSSSEVKSIIQVLNDLSPEQQAKELGMEVSALNNIIKIRASDLKGNSIVNLEIETLNREIGMSVMQKLPNYIMTRPYIVKMIEREKGLLNSNMNSLKKVIDDPSARLRLSTSHTIIYSPMLDIYSCNEKYNQLISDLNKFEENELVVFVRETIYPLKPYKPKRILIVSIGLMSGIIIGVFMVLIREWTMLQNKDS